MNHPGYGRDGHRLPPVETMSAEQIRAELVGDAVANYTGGSGSAAHQRHVTRTVALYVRLGQLERPNDPGQGAETVINSVLDEVETLTGLRALPVA